MKASLLKPLLVVGASAALVGGVHAVSSALSGPANLPAPNLIAVDASSTGGTTSGPTTTGPTTTGPTPCDGTPTSCGGYYPNCKVCPAPTNGNGSAACNGSTCGIACNTNYQPDGSGGCMPAPCGSTASSCGVNAVSGCRNCVQSAPLGSVNGSAACSNGGTTCTYACGGLYPMTCDGGQTCISCTPPQNATATCNGTACGFNCNPGYQPSGNTCIASTCAGTPTNCGASGTCRDCTVGMPPGASSASCVNARCVYACDATHLSCDGGATCAACPMTPNSRPVCSGATCTFSCNDGYTPSGSTCLSRSFSAEY